MIILEDFKKLYDTVNLYIYTYVIYIHIYRFVYQNV